jgi:uncharacterized repeat protein (TIGR03803 family)
MKEFAMPARSSSFAVVLAFVCISMFSANSFASGPVEQVLYDFPYGTAPSSGLISDSAGNLYGTTRYGGNGYGTVFELSPPTTSGGAWTETVLYAFNPFNIIDGAYPFSTLIFDKAGNLYGTTSVSSHGYGTVFELSPPTTAGGAWTRKLLMDVPVDGSKGTNLQGNLIFDSAGNLYGTTLSGGAGTTCGARKGFGCGTVFELKPPTKAGAGWTETILHSFAVAAGDGFTPGTALIIRDGILYGTTEKGGANGDGTVFQLARQSGSWVETILHNFTGTDGATPVGRLIADSSGNFYGTTYDGANAGGSGAQGCGTVYELSPPAISGGAWQETTLYSFTGSKDGSNPYVGVIRDNVGDLYGVTTYGGFKNNGVVYKLLAPAEAGGAWSQVTLHVFDAVTHDGAGPAGDLILLDGKGLFGTTYGGGTAPGGTVFNITF